ncbi:MAG: hypothetical protein H6570_20710 [Lewinellaceae bacterium]|nr:hypothetical protein [Lewinellaceae bacterium]
MNFSTKNPDVLQIKYEELLDNTEHTLLKLCKYLNINQNEITNYLDTTIEGSMGDPNQDKFKKIEKTGNWYISYNTYFRKLWAKKYLMWIGDKNLSLMGYNSMEIHQKIKDIKNDGPFLMDFLFNIISIAHSWIEPTILREKLKNKIKRISHA